MTHALQPLLKCPEHFSIFELKRHVLVQYGCYFAVELKNSTHNVPKLALLS